MEEKTQSEDPKDKVSGVLIESEMQKSFLDYAMAVIVSRALPDVRDGLKPVHRRILHSMNESGFMSNKPFKKSARIVGDVLGRYHPHGDSAVYDSMVRMAQDFSLRYTLVQGQGNFGSVDGDSAAAMRYCVVNDTLLLTDKGIVPIGEISNKKETRTNFKILSLDGKKNKSSKFFNSGKHNIIEIKTKLGYTLKGSSNHPVLCWVQKRGEPLIEWKLLKEITTKDVVILSRSSLFAKQDLNLKKYTPKSKIRVKDVGLPSKMNKDLAFLLGALVSEGSFHQGKILFCSSDMVFYNHIKDIIYDQFPRTQLYERKIAGNCLELTIYHKKVTGFLKNIGLTEVKSDKKEIPFSVLQSTKPVISNFLIGLFEGDGSVKFKSDKRHGGQSIELTYNSKSTQLISQLKTLLLNFGIVTTKPYKDKRNTCYKLIISSYDSIKRFKEEIGFFSGRKGVTLARVDAVNSSRMSTTDWIPYISDYLRRKYKSVFLKKNDFDRYNNLKKNYNKLINILNAKDKKLIDTILKQNYLFDKIDSKSRHKKENVYSIKVNSKCHSFVANGFINHNTEARLSKFSEHLLTDIKKDTVDFQPNFDGSLNEPTVLPSKAPNLLLNGSSGIAVGMATNIPPHNLIELCDGISEFIDNPDITVPELMKHIKGPDFPTGAEIQGTSGIRNAYNTGKGRVIIKSVAGLEEHKGKNRFIVNEIPYMVNKAMLIEHIANCVKEKRITGISDLRDESDRDGMRIVIELKKDANPDVVLNQLYSYTRMRVTFGVNMVALVDNVPKILGLRDMIYHFVEHRKQVVRRRTLFDLKKAEERVHILEGLIIALNKIDEIIQKIKKSKDTAAATGMLVADYKLSEVQAKAILDMKLQKLSALEQNSIKQEHLSLLELIKGLKSILESEQKVKDIIKEELSELKNTFGDERKTQILEGEEESGEIDVASLIEEEEVVVTISHRGYIKRTPIQTYKQQARGGKGVIAAKSKDEDFIESIFTSSTHSYILFFTNKGQVYWKKVYEIPEGSRQATGKAIVNLLRLSTDERITAFVPVKEFDKDHFLVLATKNGIVKKTSLIEYSRPRQGGIKAITLEKEDQLIGARLTDGTMNIMIATRNGLAIRFDEKNARPIGRTSKGVKGIELKKGDEAVSMVIPDANDKILTITENGFGKRTEVEEYRVIGRGGKGVINIQCSDRNGKVVAVKAVAEEDDIMFISQKGIMIRTAVKGISTIGRNTQGVRIMKLGSDDKVVASAIIAKEE